MVATVLLTLGRLPKGLDIARSFKANGWRVIVAEPFKRHLLGASNAVAKSYRTTAPSVSKERYLEDLLRIIKVEGVELVVPVSEETMHVSFLRERLPPGVTLFTMSPDKLLPVHNKQTFIDHARAAGLSVPETAALGEDAATSLSARMDCVIKPIHSCSGRGLRFVAKGEPLPQPDPAARAIVQQQVEGTELSTCSLAHAGQVVSTVVYRGVQRSGKVAVVFDRVENPAISEWVRRFVAASEWTGFISFDFIVDSTGTPWAIECNPRTTSGLHFWQTSDIAHAIWERGFVPAYRPERRLQQFYSALTETQMSLFRRGPFLANLKSLLQTSDVTWSSSDPMPFLTMTWSSWEIIQIAWAHDATLGEVATLDVGWYDDAA
jgi:predicted ATP-grasp superfamily ATP-dependent carboligase